MESGVERQAADRVPSHPLSRPLRSLLPATTTAWLQEPRDDTRQELSPRAKSLRLIGLATEKWNGWKECREQWRTVVLMRNGERLAGMEG